MTCCDRTSNIQLTETHSEDEEEDKDDEGSGFLQTFHPQCIVRVLH